MIVWLKPRKISLILWGDHLEEAEDVCVGSLHEKEARNPVDILGNIKTLDGW